MGGCFSCSENLLRFQQQNPNSQQNSILPSSILHKHPRSLPLHSPESSKEGGFYGSSDLQEQRLFDRTQQEIEDQDREEELYQKEKEVKITSAKQFEKRHVESTSHHQKKIEDNSPAQQKHTQNKKESVKHLSSQSTLPSQQLDIKPIETLDLNDKNQPSTTLEISQRSTSTQVDDLRPTQFDSDSPCPRSIQSVEDENEEEARLKEQKINIIRKSLSQQHSFCKNNKPALIKQEEQQTPTLPSSNNPLNDASDFSLLLLAGDSNKNSIFYGSFGQSQFKESRLILDESIIHPVKSNDIGIDSFIASKKEEEYTPELRKEESSVDLISLLQMASPSLSSCATAANGNNQITQHPYPQSISQFQYNSTEVLSSSSSKSNLFQRLDSLEKRFQAPPPPIQPLSRAESVTSQTVEKSNKEFSQPPVDKQAVEKEISRGSQEEYNENQPGEIITATLSPIKNEGESKLIDHASIKIDFSFCADSKIEAQVVELMSLPADLVPSPPSEAIEDVIIPNAVEDTVNIPDVKQQLSINQTFGDQNSNMNISIIVQDPKNNTTDQFNFVINKKPNSIGTDAAGTESISVKPVSQVNVIKRDSVIARQISQRSLLENTNRMVMQQRFSLRSNGSSSTCISTQRSSSNMDSTPKKEISVEEFPSKNSLNNQGDEEEEEKTEKFHGLSQLEQNSLIFEEEMKRQQQLQSQLHFLNPSQNPEQSSQLDPCFIPPYIALNHRSPSHTRNSSQKRVSYSSPGTPFYSCMNTPTESQRTSVIASSGDSRKNKPSIKRVHFTSTSPSAIEEYQDFESLSLSTSNQIEHRQSDVQEQQQPHLYMGWMQSLNPISKKGTIDEYYISSSVLYQLEIIKQETYQDFISKFEQEYVQNADLFDALINTPTQKVLFRNELGFDQERLFILTGEYLVNTQVYADFYNFKNSPEIQKKLNGFSSLEIVHDDIQSTVLLAKCSTKALSNQTKDFVFLKHFAFLQEQLTESYDEDQLNESETQNTLQAYQMCEIDISLNCEEIEHILKQNNHLSSNSNANRAELFSGNIATVLASSNQIKVEFMIEINLNNAITPSQAKHMYTDMFTSYFESLQAAFPV